MSEVAVRANVLWQEAGPSTLKEIQTTLRDLGLSGYAAEAFCALVRASEVTAGDLGTKTGIPDSKIYYALQELAEKGLVEVQAGKPKTYRAVSRKRIEARLNEMLEAKHERETDAVSRVGSLLEPIQAATKSPATELAYVVKGRGNVLARAEALIASARREVVLLSSQREFVTKLEGALDKAARKGRKVQLAIPAVDLKTTLERRAEIRSVVCDPVFAIVVDGQQMLTANQTMDGSWYGITSTDETLVRMGLDYWDSPNCCVS
jgi:sugar-specific transcriptional regulator TrmB